MVNDMQRTIFTKGGTVVEVSMCDPDYCDEWCRLRGFDGWAPASHDMADAFREVEEGDAITASKVPGKPFQLNKAAATVTREGVAFLTAGARNITQLRAAQAAKAAKAPKVEG